MEGDPSESRPGSSRLEDGSNSGSAPSSAQERMDLGSLQEYILNFTEDEWIVFSSLLQTPMTRMQFAETCMAVLKVVSLSSIAVILPAYVGVAKDVKTSRPTTPTPFSTIASTERPYRSLKTTSPESLKTDGDVMDESESASSSSLELRSGPVGDLARRMKGILASLRKTVAWHPPAEDSACSVSERSASTKATTAVHGGAAHDQTCITKILEKLVASGRIHTIANNLVSQIQGAIQDSGPASTPVFDSVLSATVKVVPKRTLSASHVVHKYAEEAIKNLLQPYFLPLVAMNENHMTSTKTSSSSYASSRPHSATSKGTSPSLLGLELEKDECSCLMTKLMQRLPADVSLTESAVSSRSNSAPHGRITGSPSQRFSEVVDLFTRVMIFQVMEMVDTELKRHEQVRLPSLDQEETPIEGEMSTESNAGWYGGLFSGLIQRFLSEFLCTEDALGDDTPSSPRSLSTHSGSGRCESSPENLKKVLELFTRLMVSQVMDIIQVESSLPLVSRPCSSSVEFSILGSDAFTDGTSVVGADSSDNGCLVTALMLRLLVKLRDQSTAPPDTVQFSRELIGKLLSEFSSATGTPDFHTYPNNVKLQTIYKAMDKFLLKEFGSETVLQRAVETQDESFDTILLSGLREELLPQCDVEVTAVPSPQSSSHGQRAMGRPRKWLKIKMPKLGRKKVSLTNTLSDSTGERVETLPCHTPSVSTSGQRPRKHSFFRRMFTCCFKGSSEH